MVLSLILINGRQRKYIVMMPVSLPSDLIEASLVADQKMNGRKSLSGMIYRPPSEPQVHIARILINVKEKNTMNEKKEDGIFAYIVAIALLIASVIMTIINRLNGDNE